jgi:anti-sigma B factor antagonist
MLSFPYPSTCVTRELPLAYGQAPFTHADILRHLSSSHPFPSQLFVGAVKGRTMSLKITNSETNGTSVVTLDGRIVLGEEGDALREKLKNLIGAGKKQIVVNMELIKSIDSAGLGTLFAAHVSAEARGASLKLCNVSCRFQEVLQTTRLATVFQIFNTEAVAVKSFSNEAHRKAALSERNGIS